VFETQGLRESGVRPEKTRSRFCRRGHRRLLPEGRLANGILPDAWVRLLLGIFQDRGFRSPLLPMPQCLPRATGRFLSAIQYEVRKRTRGRAPGTGVPRTVDLIAFRLTTEKGHSIFQGWDRAEIFASVQQPSFRQMNVRLVSAGEMFSYFPGKWPARRVRPRAKFASCGETEWMNERCLWSGDCVWRNIVSDFAMGRDRSTGRVCSLIISRREAGRRDLRFHSGCTALLSRDDRPEPTGPVLRSPAPVRDGGSCLDQSPLALSRRTLYRPVRIGLLEPLNVFWLPMASPPARSISAMFEYHSCDGTPGGGGRLCSSPA